MVDNKRGEYQLAGTSSDSEATYRQPQHTGSFRVKLCLILLLVTVIFGSIITIKVSVYNHPNTSADFQIIGDSNRRSEILLHANSSTFSNALINNDGFVGNKVTFDYEILLKDSLSPSEKDSIDSLLNVVGHKLTCSYMKTYNYLIRWLRVRDWNVEDAKEMLLDHLEWRAEYEVDSIMEDNFTLFETEFPYYSDGIDYAGAPVITMSIGDWDLRKISVGGTQREFVRYCVRGFEQTVQERIVSKALLIMNVDNYSFSISVLGQLLFAMADNYPGLLNHLFIINASSLANEVIELLKPYLGEENRAALKIFGFEKQAWQREILKLTAADQIRREFGGTKVDLEL